MRKSTIILAMLVALAMSYFSYEIIFIFPMLPASALLANYALIGVEMLCALFSIYLYHAVFCTLEWKSPKLLPISKLSKTMTLPFISLHIPTFNEPMEIVQPTLEAAMNQDYPKNKYEIIVADDSTDNEKMNALQKFCKKHKIKFLHRDNRNGYKAGALNNSEKHSHTKAKVISILDADDIPSTNFLTATTQALFADKKVAFVQTRNCERNSEENRITGVGRLIRDLFFGAIMKSKDLRNLGIFCGSGGAIKRALLKKFGGWPEDTVTEDIDLSTILFSHGYTSTYLNPSHCSGLLPPTFTGLCGQLFRWSYGTTRTLVLRWKMIFRIPGIFRKIEHFLSCMTYLLGPAIVIMSLIMISHLWFQLPVFHMYEVPTLWLFGGMLTVSSFLALLFVQLRDSRVSISNIIYYILAIFGLSVNFTKGAISAVLGRKLAFFRTPRHAKKDHSIKHSLKMILKFLPETIIGLAAVAAALVNILNPVYAAQASWVLLIGIGFLTAPYFAIKYN